MKEQIETSYPAETLWRFTGTTTAKRLLGIAAERYRQPYFCDSATSNSTD